MNKQFLVTILIFAIAASTANPAPDDPKSDESSDFIEDAKTKLAKAKDTVSEGFSDLVANEKVQSAVGYISNKTAGATEVIKDAASKTGSFFGDAWSKISEKGKTGFSAIKDYVQGKKESEYRDGEGIINARSFEGDIIKTPNK